MMSTKQQKFAPVMNHIDKLDTIVIHHKRRIEDTSSVTYKMMRDQDDNKDIISVSCVDDANVCKEEKNNTHKQGDVSIFLTDEHDTLLLDVTLTKLSCSRRITKVDSPNGFQLGFVKKGRFSAYELCDANHHSIFHFDLESKNHEYKTEVKDIKNGNSIAVIKQHQIDSDIVSFEINYKSTPNTLQKILIMVAVISGIQQQQEDKQCSLIRRFSFAVAIYILIGLFSIVLYIFALLNTLLFIVCIMIPVVPTGSMSECFEKWGVCNAAMYIIPCIIIKN